MRNKLKLHSCWITVVWIFMVNANPSKNSDPIDFTVVRDSTIFNASSSTDGLPAKLNISFQVLGVPVTLNLERNQKMKNANTVSVIRMSEGGVPVIIQQILEDHELSGEYHDLSKSAIFTWSCVLPKTNNNNNARCRPTLEGTFRSGENNYRMQVMDNSAMSLVDGGTSANIMKLWSRAKDIVVGATTPTQVYGIYPVDTAVATATDYKVAEPLIQGRSAAFGKEARVVRENVLPGGKMYNLEVLAIIDYSIYERFYKASELGTERGKDNEAKYNIKKYFSHVFNGVDMLYQNIDDLNFSLSVGLSGFIIADTPDVSPWTTPHINRKSTGRHELLVSTPLNELIRWSFRARNIPESDHIMLMTDYDLYSIDSGVVDKRTAGYARVGSVCSLDSVSVIEDHGGFQSINAAAHELGHGLGARHDGTRNQCNPRAQYIMTAHGGFESENTKRNPWQFSECSVSYFKEYINTLSINNCLTDPVDLFDEAAFRQFVSNYPGQEMTPNEQCQDILGLDSFYGWGTELGAFSQICNEMSCSVPGSSRSYRVYKAATGTSCGDKQWCIEGQCVFDERAPSRNPSCVFGDTQRRFSGGKSCRQYMLENPMRCYDKFYKDRCCDTCDKLNTGVSGCEYGDKFLNCNPRNCGSRYYARDCCSTCGLAPRPVISSIPDITVRPKPVTRAPPVITHRPINPQPTRRPVTSRPRPRPTTTTTARPVRPSVPDTTPGSPLEPSGDSGLCLRRDNRFLLVFRCSSLPNLFGQAACDNPLISRFCCERCPEPGTPACEDKPSCKVQYARECYIPSNRDDCCRTCKRFNTGSLGCEFGDRIRSCERYIGELGLPAVCSRYKKYCCGICEGFSAASALAKSPSSAVDTGVSIFDSTSTKTKDTGSLMENVLQRESANSNFVIVGSGKRNISNLDKKRPKSEIKVSKSKNKRKNSNKKKNNKNKDNFNTENNNSIQDNRNSVSPVEILSSSNGGIIIRGLPMRTFVMSHRPMRRTRWGPRRRRRQRMQESMNQLQLAVAGK